MRMKCLNRNVYGSISGGLVITNWNAVCSLEWDYVELETGECEL